MIKKTMKFPEVELAGYGKKNDGEDELDQAGLIPRNHGAGFVLLPGPRALLCLLPDLTKHETIAMVCLLMLSTCFYSQVVDCYPGWCLVGEKIHK